MKKYYQITIWYINDGLSYTPAISNNVYFTSEAKALNAYDALHKKLLADGYEDFACYVDLHYIDIFCNRGSELVGIALCDKIGGVNVYPNVYPRYRNVIANYKEAKSLA